MAKPKVISVANQKGGVTLPPKNDKISSAFSYNFILALTYIRPKLGSVPLNKLTTNELQQFFNWMKKDGRTLHRESRGGGLSDNMVRNCHSLCRRALEKAVSDRLIVKNPIEGCKAPPIRREEMQLLTREEPQRLLIQAKDEGYCEVFLLELTTGLRVGELMALQWGDLNLKTGELRIERQVYRTKEELLIQEPKTKASMICRGKPPQKSTGALVERRLPQKVPRQPPATS